ncbi:MAG: branched-chain amino acid ABC transporter substrate-binding protein [Pseudonocardiaceae bacterium]
MSRMRQAAAAIVAASALVLAACGTSTPEGGGGGTTGKIGFVGDLTGENSGLVIPPRNGAHLAVDEYNATNPATKIELIDYDSQAKPEQATALVTKAIGTDKIVGLVGPAFSGESKAVGSILEQGKIPSVSPSATNPGLAQNGWKYWHRVVANDAQQGPGIANFLIAAKSPKSAFVISDDQEYSVGIAEAVAKTFQEKGITTGTDRFAKGASDYSSTVTKVKAANPEVIFYGGYYAQAGPLLKQLRDGGVAATTVYASGDGSLDKGLIDGAGTANAEGAVIGCPCNIPFGAQTGNVKTFSDAYKAKYNADPLIYATEGYDSATILINAVKGGTTTGEAINAAIAGGLPDGISKKIVFSPTGELEGGIILVYQVKGGAITSLGPSTEAKLS